MIFVSDNYGCSGENRGCEGWSYGCIFKYDCCYDFFFERLILGMYWIFGFIKFYNVFFMIW